MKCKKRLLLFYIPLLLLICINIMTLFRFHLINKNNILVYKQLLWLIISIILIIIINKINIHNFFKLSFLIYLFNIFLLVLVLIKGEKTHGARAWLKLGIFSFQPSEFMKLSLSLFLANLVDKTNIKKKKDEIILILKFIIIILIPSILVFLEPDTGAIVFYIIIALTILYNSNIKKTWFIILTILFFCCILIFNYTYINNKELIISLLGNSIFYRIERILKFHPNKNYQLNNALINIGNANFIKLNNKHLYIPEETTDFIYAHIIGQYGIFYGIIIPFLYILIIIFLESIYILQTDKKIKLFLISFINLFLFNIFINIAMNLGIIPIMGIPLPFISYGGSTLISYSIYLGIIIKSINNISDMEHNNYNNDYNKASLDNN